MAFHSRRGDYRPSAKVLDISFSAQVLNEASSYFCDLVSFIVLTLIRPKSVAVDKFAQVQSFEISLALDRAKAV